MPLGVFRTIDLRSFEGTLPILKPCSVLDMELVLVNICRGFAPFRRRVWSCEDACGHEMAPLTSAMDHVTVHVPWG